MPVSYLVYPCLFRDYGELADAHFFLVVNDTGRYQADSFPLYRLEAYGLLDRISLDIRELAGSHHASVYPKLVVGNVSGRVTTLIGRITETGECIRFV